MKLGLKYPGKMIYKRNGTPFTVFFYFNIAYPKIRKNIVGTFKSPWINKDAIIARAKLKDLYNLYMQSKTQEHRDIYKAYKKEYNVILKTANANYIQNIITSSNNTSKVL
jgi:hypothetical protein